MPDFTLVVLPGELRHIAGSSIPEDLRTGSRRFRARGSAQKLGRLAKVAGKRDADTWRFEAVGARRIGLVPNPQPQGAYYFLESGIPEK